MRQVEHHIQDAMEPYAVGVMQTVAEQLGLAPKGSAEEHFRVSREHLKTRGVSPGDLATYPEYKSSADLHASAFANRIIEFLKPRTLVFEFNEKEARNAGRKEDFVVVVDNSTRIPFSLKNYRKSIARPQVSAGTFNSLACSFIFEPAGGVGMFIEPISGKTFKGSSRSVRDAAITSAGQEPLLKIFEKLDALSDEIKEVFVYSPQFEFLDEDAFDSERKRVGKLGAEMLCELVSSLQPDRVRNVMLTRIGFDGECEQLMFDPDSYSDSLTVPRFSEVIGQVRGGAELKFQAEGQSLRFEFLSDENTLLSVDIPFTINKNGAWISEEYAGTRYHPKEKVALAHGQRRPKKSKELATSVNTYINYEAAGIFIHT